MGAITLTESPPAMGRKKNDRKTVMIRAYEEFTKKVSQASGERGLSAADFCEQFLTPCVEKIHRDYIEEESRKLASGERK